MAWNGYFSYDGNEVINVARTEAYARQAGLHWLIPTFKNDALPTMLGEKYVTPLLDDAPWIDSDDPASFDFMGFYPLDVTGIEDSTRSSAPVESLAAGGSVGSLRIGTKQLVFSGILIAATEAGANYGFEWLSQALLGSACGVNDGRGADLCFLSSVPELPYYGDFSKTLAVLNGGNPYSVGPLLDGGVLDSTVTLYYDGGIVGVDDGGGTLDLDGNSVGDDILMVYSGGGPFDSPSLVKTDTFPWNVDIPAPIDYSECMDDYTRTMRRVLFNSGPSITAKRSMYSGGAAWSVTATAIAGSPYQIGPEIPVIEGFLDPLIDIPWAGGVVPEGGAFNLNGFLAPETDCLSVSYSPLYDPLAPALISPPSVPSVPLGFYDPPTNWLRRQITIPAQFIPSWGEVVPLIKVSSRGSDMRNLRVRFYADPSGQGSIEDDPCAFCGDIVFSFVPEDHTIVFDGTDESVYSLGPGNSKRRADSLVFATDGSPFDWPALTCGSGYVVTFDLPQTQVPPVIDLSLFRRVA